MINPLAPVFNWFIAFTLSLPTSFMAFVSFYWAVLVAVGVVTALWKAKH